MVLFMGKRFKLTDNYKGNTTVPIADTDYDYDDELFITEVVYKLNSINNENELNKKIIKILVEYIMRCELK